MSLTQEKLTAAWNMDSDGLTPGELLLFLEQLSDAPSAAHASAPLTCLPRHEIHPKAPVAAISMYNEEAKRQCFKEGSVVAEPMSASDEPIFTTEEREMLLMVLQDPVPEPGVHGHATGNTRAEQASVASGSGHFNISSGSRSGAIAGERFIAATGTRHSTRRSDESGASMESSSVTDSTSKAQQAPHRKQARRPNRRRRKHDVFELREQVQELTKELIRLRVQGQSLTALSLIQQQQQRHAGANNKRLAMEASTVPSAWQLAAVTEREKMRAAVLENSRLRAQYESQLKVLQQLQAMCWNQFDFATMGSFSVPGSSLTKRPRLDPFDDDFTIFASLGRDFDSQYEDIDRILEAAGLLHFDGELAAELRTKTDSRGKFFMESMHSRVIPQDMFVMDRAINETSKSPKLHQHHKSYEVRHATDTISFIKFVDVIRLPHAEATLTVRMAVKRFVFPDRVAGVWESVIDVSGCVSMRLHERGWNTLRPPRVKPANHMGGPLSIEQSCLRYFPIDNAVSSEQDLAAGTVNRIFVDSYRRHLHRMHEITDDILSKDFDKLSLA